MEEEEGEGEGEDEDEEEEDSLHMLYLQLNPELIAYPYLFLETHNLHQILWKLTHINYEEFVGHRKRKH